MIKVRRLSSRKIRLPMKVKLFSRGQTVFRSTFYKKSALITKIKVIPWDKAYIKVCYSHKLYNDGFYNNYQDLKEALSVFTEKALLDFVEGKKL